MKASQLVINLQELIKKHGDQEIIYSKDDEGNEYRKIHYEPSAGSFDEDEREFQEVKELNAFCIN